MRWNHNWCKLKHAQTCLYYDQVASLATKSFRERCNHTRYLSKNSEWFFSLDTFCGAIITHGALTTEPRLYNHYYRFLTSTISEFVVILHISTVLLAFGFYLLFDVLSFACNQWGIVEYNLEIQKFFILCERLQLTHSMVQDRSWNPGRCWAGQGISGFYRPVLSIIKLMEARQVSVSRSPVHTLFP